MQLTNQYPNIGLPITRYGRHKVHNHTFYCQLVGLVAWSGYTLLQLSKLKHFVTPISSDLLLSKSAKDLSWHV